MTADIPPHEYVEVRSSIGLLDPDSLEERIRRAEHDAGMPINALGRQSHCWLCRAANDRGEGENARLQPRSVPR